MAVKLYTITSDGNIEINKLELFAIEPFKKIIRRDRDRNKSNAFKELGYIYHYADLRSEGIRKGYNDKKRHDNAIDKVGLDKNWLPDEVILEAIEYYKKEQEIPGADMIRDILSLFQLNAQVIKKTKKTITDLLIKDKLTKEEALEMLNMNQLVFNFAKEIPRLTKDLLDLLKETNINDGGTVMLLRGSKIPVPDSYDPDRSL